jgi:hypothetical protein
MTDALFDSPAKRSTPALRQRADIAAQGKCLAILQLAGHVVHVGKSGTFPGSLFH